MASIRSLLFTLLLMAGLFSVAQSREYVPFSEATNAIRMLEQEPIIKDSLKRIYIDRVTLGFTFGQRFISGSNKTERPDTITFTDFSDRRGFIGLEIGYFLKDQLQISMSGDLLMLPKEQEISSVQFGGNGISIEGEGSGGAMITIGIEGRYIFKEKELSRPYVKLEAGFIRALAVGGEGGFSVGQGQFQNQRELRESYRYLQPGIGFAHRMARQAMLEFNLSYLISADRSRNIGGITSPGGITASIGFHFVFGSNK
ncbi:MAG: hypothetical protein R8G66_04390 [Cytophagales bacterium]|nr:hypothetical protein [Cytophagales bacterium]